MNKQNDKVTLTVEGRHKGLSVVLHDGRETRAALKPDQAEIVLP